jgi:hypothetical protein
MNPELGMRFSRFPRAPAGRVGHRAATIELLDILAAFLRVLGVFAANSA